MEAVNQQVINNLWKKGRVDWVHLPVVRTVGDILLMWDCDKMKCKEVVKGRVSISCLFKWSGRGNDWAFSRIYCRGSRKERNCLWDELMNCKVKWGDRWVIGGDFNIILNKGERSGKNVNQRKIEEFGEWVDKLELVDISLMGGKWTWSSSSDRLSWSRIDLFLISNGLLAQFAGLSQKVLQRPIFDHFTICIILDGIIWGPRPFRLDNK